MATDSQKPSSGRGGEWHFVSSQDEIKELERKLQQKKDELAGGSLTPAGSAMEKNLFREVMREHIAEKGHVESGEKSPATAAPGMGVGTPAASVSKKSDDEVKKQMREEKIRGLVETAMTRGIEST